MPDTKQNIVGLNLEEIKQILLDLGEKSFRAKQIWHWIYRKGVMDFDQMRNLPESLIDKLKANYNVMDGVISSELISFDETRKWLIKFSDGNEIEAVYIPEKTRATLCVSSQVGCT
jgi:23S rRNA (adenine2503-C2)-methyltransferase